MDYRSNQTDIRYHRRNQTDIRDHRRKQKEVRNHGGNSTDIMDHRSNQTEIRYHRRNQTDIRDHRRNMTDISNHRRNLTDLGVQRKNLANLRDHRRNRTDAKEHRRNRTQGYLGNGDRRGANPISIDSDAPLGNTRDAKAVSLNGTFNISDSVDVEGQSDVTEGSGCEGDTCEDSDGMGKDISASVDSADVRATDYDYAEESEVDEFAGHSDDFGETYDPREKNQELTPGYAAHLGRKGPRGNRQVKPWPNAVIPYIVVGSETTKMRVLKALEHIKSKTCLTFKSRANEQRYLHIKDHDGGCWTSSLGYPSSDKAVIVGLGNGCRSVGGVIHEVLHAAGFFHEHNRPDRNAFIEIKWSNIDRKQRHNFRLENRYSLTDVPYDYKSVMHYGRKAFAVDRSKPTLVPKTPMKGNLGGSRLTPHDVERINAFYNC